MSGTSILCELSVWGYYFNIWEQQLIVYICRFFQQLKMYRSEHFVFQRRSCIWKSPSEPTKIVWLSTHCSDTWSRRDITRSDRLHLQSFGDVSNLVHALLCTAGGWVPALLRLWKSSEAYSTLGGLLILLCSSSGHGKGSCGERLPQIDPLNMEGFSREEMHDRILGLSTKQLL